MDTFVKVFSTFLKNDYELENDINSYAGDDYDIVSVAATGQMIFVVFKRKGNTAE